ncbi:MAG: PEP-CTERM sorting domain-containing protein [Polaromonas sp.]|nr:PEP-CTERM sorting domain-containing protein [Polaromonas sp.]
MKYRLLTLSLCCLGHYSNAVAQNSVTATASSGFDTAQLRKTESFYATYSRVVDPITGIVSYPNNAASSQAASASTQFDFRGQTANASTTVNGPSLMTAAASVSSSSLPLSPLRASADASFSDLLTFSANGFQQDTVLVFMKYGITGTGTTSASSFSSQISGSSNLRLSLGGGYASEYGSVSSNSGSSYTSGYLSSGYQYSPYKIFAVTLGSDQNFNISLSASCQMNSVLGGGACSDSATFTYGGIAGLAQLNGTEITNYSVKSLSGYDYVNAVAPVPEPETYAMMLAGLCLIGGIAKRRGVRQV